MIILRATTDYKADGGEDEAFVVIYRDLDRAKEECRKALGELIDDQTVSDEIEWGVDQESAKNKKVYFGRPKAEVDGYFQVYQVWIE